jgi:hypothetical protein
MTKRVAAAACALLVAAVAAACGSETPTAPASTLAPPAPHIPSPTASARVLNARDFGAVGDGRTDDRAAIQRAVDACAAGGGGVVRIPAGDYRLDSGDFHAGSSTFVAIRLADDIHLVGDGRGKTVLRSERRGLNLIGSFEADGISVSSMTLAGGDQDGVKVEASSRVSVTDVEAHGFYIGIAAYGCTGVRITGCVAYANSGFGFVFGGQDGAPGGDDQVWTDCEAYACQQGFRVFSKQGTEPRVTNVTAESCESHDNRGEGLLVTSAEHVTVRDGVYSDNTTAGIMLVDTHDSLIYRPTTMGNGGYGDIFIAPYPTSDWWSEYGPSSNITVIRDDWRMTP